MMFVPSNPTGHALKPTADNFLAVVRPALERGDAEAVLRVVEPIFSRCEVKRFLEHQDADVRRVAAFVTGLMGDACAVGALSRSLHDQDESVARMAEHGLWSIWFQGGSPRAAEPFAQGVKLLGEDRLDEALAELESAVALDPDFAEAHNQCAIALYLLGRYEQSIEHCKQALARVPAHFGAMAGMGHGHAHLGRLDAALGCYRKALAMNPMLPCIADAIARIQARLEPSAAAPAPASPRPRRASGSPG